MVESTVRINCGIPVGLKDFKGVRHLTSFKLLSFTAIYRKMVILTGLYLLSKLAESRGITTNDFFRSYESIEEVEIGFHFIEQWPDLAIKIKKFLTSHFLASMTKLSNSRTFQ